MRGRVIGDENRPSKGSFPLARASGLSADSGVFVDVVVVFVVVLRGRRNVVVAGVVVCLEYRWIHWVCGSERRTPCIRLARLTPSSREASSPTLFQYDDDGDATTPREWGTRNLRRSEVASICLGVWLCLWFTK